MGQAAVRCSNLIKLLKHMSHIGRPFVQSNKWTGGPAEKATLSLDGKRVTQTTRQKQFRRIGDTWFSLNSLHQRGTRKKETTQKTWEHSSMVPHVTIPAIPAATTAQLVAEVSKPSVIRSGYNGRGTLYSCMTTILEIHVNEPTELATRSENRVEQVILTIRQLSRSQALWCKSCRLPNPRNFGCLQNRATRGFLLLPFESNLSRVSFLMASLWAFENHAKGTNSEGAGPTHRLLPHSDRSRGLASRDWPLHACLTMNRRRPRRPFSQKSQGVCITLSGSHIKAGGTY